MATDSEVLREFEKQQASFLARMADVPSSQEVALYENRFVALLDILGFSAALSDFAASSPNELFHAIVDSHWFHAASRDASCDFQLFSDSIIVSSKDDHPASFISVANILNDLRNSFLERGLLLRGAIAFGPHFNKYGICISPALVEAYELEKRFAINPRFLVSGIAAERVLSSVTRKDSGRFGIIGPRWFHVARDQLPVRDADGLMVVEFLPDTLEPYFLRTGHHHDPAYTPTPEQLTHFRSVGPQVLARWKIGLETARARCKKPEHHQKVDYLVTKWNEYVQSFKELSKIEKERFTV